MRLKFGQLEPVKILKAKHPLAVLTKIFALENILANCHLTDEERNDISLIKLEKTRFVKHISGTKIKLNTYGDVGTFGRLSPAIRGESPTGTKEIDLGHFTAFISMPHQQGTLLYLLAKRLAPKHILELGTGFGISALYLLRGASHTTGSKLDTVERWKYASKFHHLTLGKFAEKNYTSISQSTGKALIDLIRNNAQYELIFHDATHIADELKDELEQVFSILVSGGILIWDDINFSPQTMALWKKISAKDNVIYSATFPAGYPGKLGIIIKC